MLHSGELRAKTAILYTVLKYAPLGGLATKISACCRQDKTVSARISHQIGG